MQRRFLLLTLMAGGLLLAAVAPAATVELTGPAGARIELDGRSVGTLPLAAPLEVSSGEHTLVATLRGMQDWRHAFQIGAHETIRLHVRVIPLSRKDAVVGSLLLAGSGQRYEGRNRLGWILTGAEIVGGVTALLAEIAYQNNRDDYLAAMADYRAAVNQDEIARLRAQAADKYTSMDDAASLRDAAVAVAVAAVAVSVLDAWLRFPRLEAGDGVLPVAPRPESEDADGPVHWSAAARPGVHLGLRLSF